MKSSQKPEFIDGFDGESLHPALDIKDDVLVIGFRYKDKSGKEKDVVLAHHNGLLEKVNGDHFEVGEKRYFLEKKGRKLMLLRERWDLKDANNLFEDYINPPKEIAPKPQKLWDEVMALIKRYIDLEENIDFSLIAAWVIGTYFFPIFSAYPFLHIKAPKHSGKSQLLNILQLLCFNAVKARPTVAAFGDTVDALRGTYLIDQADSLDHKGNEELLAVITDSYKKGGGKRRVILFDKGKRSVLEIETYSPKALASTKDLPEDLRDRCFIIPLIRSGNNFLDPYEGEDGFKATRKDLYRFLIDNFSNIATEYLVRKIEYQRNPEVLGRKLELWLPFEVMLRCFHQDKIISAARERFLSSYSYSEYEPSEVEREILSVILQNFDEKDTATLSPREINEILPPNTFPSEMSDNKRTVRIGWTIKNFNLSSSKKRTKEGTEYVFEKAKVEMVYNRYFPTSSTPEDEKAETSSKGEGERTKIDPPLV